ncbi:MAG TPA: hypothetical protein VFM65_03355 [Flavobacteriaceae bacterium]|nr:hypothetical protein [Flavobacteriaceae bacterium]
MAFIYNGWFVYNRWRISLFEAQIILADYSKIFALPQSIGLFKRFGGNYIGNWGLFHNHPKLCALWAYFFATGFSSCPYIHVQK